MKNLSEILETFIERLKELMFDKKLNIKQLSNNIGIPRTTISGWINAKRSPQPDSLYKLADYFCVTIDYLLGRES